MSKTYWIWVLTASAVASALVLVLARSRGEAPALIHGRMEPEAVVAAAVLGGRVEAVLARRGQHVEAGQVLVRFDAQELDERLSRASAALREAPAHVIATTASFVERVPPATWASLLQTDPARLQAEREYVAALASMESNGNAAAHARLKRAEAQRVTAFRRADDLRPHTLANLETVRAEAQRTILWLKSQRERLEVRSPVSGTVELLDLMAGDTVMPGAAVALVDLPGRWVVTARGRRASGIPVEVRLPDGTRVDATTADVAEDGQVRVLLSTAASGARAGDAVGLRF